MPADVSLIELPQEVLHFIVSRCSVPVLPRAGPITLASVRQVCNNPPHQLLPVLQSHPTLTNVVKNKLKDIDTLSSSVGFPKMTHWLGLLGPHVTGISLSEPFGPVQDQPFPPYRQGFPSMSVLESISRNMVCLQVLDIQGVPFATASVTVKERLERALSRVLEYSAPSLQQLAFKADQVCIRSLRKFEMPCLEVLAIKSGDKSLAEGLQAIWEVQKEVREIRIEGQSLTEAVMRSIGDSHLLQQVERLRVISVRSIAPIRGFEAFFRKMTRLKVVFWYGLIHSEPVEALLNGCPNLQALHVWEWETFRREPAEHDLFLHFDELGSPDTFLQQAGSRLISFQQKFYISAERSLAIATHSQQLQELSVKVDRENMKDLILITEKCRRLRRLELTRANRGAEFENSELPCWKVLGDVLDAASEKLSVLVLHYQVTVFCPEQEEDAMVDRFCHFFKSMGTHAKSINFSIPTNTNDYGILLPRFTKLLDCALEHNSNLEELTLDFGQLVEPWYWYNLTETERRPIVLGLRLAIEKAHRRMASPLWLDLKKLETIVM